MSSSANENIPPTSIPFPSGPEQDDSFLAALSSHDSLRRASSPNPGATNKFYMTNSSKPFARSAAHRQSVMTLPPIEYLQHQYVKLGIRDSSGSSMPTSDSPASVPNEPIPSTSTSAADSKRLLGSKRMSPGPLKLLVQKQQGMLRQLTEEDLPPSPERPEIEIKVPWDQGRSVKGEKELRREVKERVKVICHHWKLDIPTSIAVSRNDRSSLGLPLDDSNEYTCTPKEAPPEPLNLGSLLHSTISAIRSVQSYIVSTPHLISVLPVSDEPTSHGGSHFLERSTVDRPRISVLTSAPQTRRVSASSAKTSSDDPLSVIRKASLNLLGVLQEIDSRHRLSLPLSSLSEDSLRSTNLPSEESTPSLSAGSGGSTIFSESNASYQQGVTLDDLTREKAVVETWIKTVDYMLSGGLRKRETSSSSINSEEANARGRGEEDEEDGTPKWAREELDEVNTMDRAYSIISAHLGPELRNRLPAPSNASEDIFVWRNAILEVLSDGHILLLTFNAVARSSNRPFGFVPLTSIHSFASAHLDSKPDRRSSSESSASSTSSSKKIGELYRRTENLQLWTGAIKFRYNLDLAASGFDAKLIARKGEGWERVFENAVRAWVQAVINEARDV